MRSSLRMELLKGLPIDGCRRSMIGATATDAAGFKTVSIIGSEANARQGTLHGSRPSAEAELHEIVAASTADVAASTHIVFVNNIVVDLLHGGTEEVVKSILQVSAHCYRWAEEVV